MRGSSLRRPVMIQWLRQIAVTIKIKHLLCCCIVLAFVLFATRASNLMGWTSDDGATALRYSTPRKRYAILMNTWKRHDLLKQSISHYTTCMGVESIHIVWSEPDPPPDSLVAFLQRTVKENSRNDREIELRFEMNKEDSLNNRFKEIKDLNTDAIFSVDDDVIFACSTLEFAFTVWQSASETMVGFVPRMHWIDQAQEEVGKYIYGGWWSVWWTGTYSMVLSKAAFFHSKYLGIYTHHMPASIRNYVTKNRNCEDIAMSFVVANVSGAPPVWVKGRIYEIGSGGISSLGGHSKRRSKCVNTFVEEYGGMMPLVPSTVKAVDSRHLWFW
ncbi:glycosyltransferase family 64 protein C4 [Cucurbita pepo subsp. pepo]|uniref:glycosyltransferase family 64 protein C4 n=1 Tax=Cucurbita pepo subsp. pepo TaxID=3664 RepID=UPI000C9D7121|nr:glycosyltransferase family 64 protein C4 [Cucurbita pepo subsp. pepo]